jgi:transposase
MDGVAEIITGRERRRRWSLEDKLRLVAETYEPGTPTRAVAARYSVCESLLFTWRRQVRDGVLVATPDLPVFVPVQVVDRSPASVSAPCIPTPPSVASTRPTAPSGLIEIELGNGQHVRVGSDVNLAALRRVLAALRA